MLRDSLNRYLTPRRKVLIKEALSTAEKSFAGLPFRYEPEDLARRLTSLGVRRGDSLLVHGSFRHATGFTGRPQDVIECLLDAVGVEGKVLFFDVPFDTFTFIHYIEDLLEDSLPFPVYRDEPMPGRVVDDRGNKMVVPTRVFSEQAVATRDPAVLEKRLLGKGLRRRGKVGRTRLMLANSDDAVREAMEMASQGIFFYRSGKERR
jgi:aminoglycoside N3'-acetyltransferase